MAAEDVEGAERPVREQLKKASIGGMSQDASLAAASVKAANEGGNGAEHEEVAASKSEAAKQGEKTDSTTSEEQPKTTRYHTRKRSRDSTAEDDELNEHKRKISGERSRAQSPVAEQSATNGAAKPKPGDRSGTPDPAARAKQEAPEEAVVSPKVKRSKLQDETATTDADKLASTETTKIPSGSGFANTSAASPFGSLESKKSSPSENQPQTSSSAFAASGFGALSGSPTSGFGAIGKTSGGFGSGGGFGSEAKSPLGGEAKEENEKPSGSAFGGSLGQKPAFASSTSSGSGFGSGASGFGKVGQTSGLGSGFGGNRFSSGGGLTSFGSGKSTPLSGAIKQAKAFGAPPDEDDGDDTEGADDDNAGSKSPLVVEEDEKDERFFEQEIETGEEGETTTYSCRAKLYNYVTLPDGKKEWRERGLGLLKLNSTTEEGHEKPKARFLMRADGSHRLMLNTPVKKGIKFGTPSGGPPTNGFIYFMGTFEGRENLELLQLKVGHTERMKQSKTADFAFADTPTVRIGALREDPCFATGDVSRACSQSKGFRPRYSCLKLEVCT